MPSTNPPRSVPTLRCGSSENGFSRMCWNRGMIRPSPMSTRTAMPAQRRKSCGRCSRSSSSEPISVKTLKLTMSPAMTRYGRQRDTGLARHPASASSVPRTLHATGEKDHRQHGQDARRDAGDESTGDADERKREEHRGLRWSLCCDSSSEPCAGSTGHRRGQAVSSSVFGCSPNSLPDGSEPAAKIPQTWGIRGT